MSEQTPEAVYEAFWRPLVETDGQLDKQKLMNELFDYWQVMERVPEVYCYVTGGHCSKILTDPRVVCSLADEHYSENEE